VQLFAPYKDRDYFLQWGEGDATFLDLFKSFYKLIRTVGFGGVGVEMENPVFL